MVVPTMLYVFAIELLLMDGFRYLERPLPIRISSIPAGAQVRPGIYSIIEDVVSTVYDDFDVLLIVFRFRSMVVVAQPIVKP